jgi:hypothetical protein
MRSIFSNECSLFIRGPYYPSVSLTRFRGNPSRCAPRRPGPLASTRQRAGNWDRRLNNDPGSGRASTRLGALEAANTNRGGVTWVPEASQISDWECVSGKS